jgi:tRNA pseudouridine55 synthase
MSIDAILNVNKPEGLTSFSVVNYLRRLSGEKHVGHTGTLDPIATGVLPLCFGQATRIVEFLMNSDKTYIAEIELGASTTTFDREGEVTGRSTVDGITLPGIEKALAAFRGVIEQVPPKYSALKHQGRPLYELAREGIEVEPRPRRVTIYCIEITDFHLPLLNIKVDCSKGTYIRSIAHDLGQLLGCGAHLKNLKRTRCGSFCIEDAHTLPEMEMAFRQHTWLPLFQAVDSPLSHWKAVILNRHDEIAIKNGLDIDMDNREAIDAEYCRAYGTEGNLIAIMRFLAGEKLWHPEKVFIPAIVSLL